MTPGQTGQFRILVVEDEVLIAIEIEDTLLDMGCVVVGPAGKLSTALRLAADEMLDGAILDVNINGGTVFPVAEKLLERGIPFVLASGYSNWALPELMRNHPRLNKPYTTADLKTMVKTFRAQMTSRTIALEK